MEIQEPAYTLSSRSVPVPTGASQEVQRAILETPVPDVTQWQNIDPVDSAQWAAVISVLDQVEMSIVTTHLSKEQVSVERDTIDGVPVFYVSPPGIDASMEKSLFVFVHGGGYVCGAGEAGLTEALLIASQLEIPVLAIDYRMPPEHPFPAALHDVVTVYKHLLGERPAQSIALGGSSAGGGLVLASVHRFKEYGLDVPGAVFSGTPWTDLTKTGDSYYVNEGLDRSLVSYEGVLAAAAKLYAGTSEIENQFISPIYGDFEGFPPVLLTTGSRDLFLSCTIRAHTKLRMAGVTADLLVFEGQSHGDYALLIDSPESVLFYKELKSFLLQYLQ